MLQSGVFEHREIKEVVPHRTGDRLSQIDEDGECSGPETVSTGTALTWSRNDTAQVHEDSRLALHGTALRQSWLQGPETSESGYADTETDTAPLSSESSDSGESIIEMIASEISSHTRPSDAPYVSSGVHHRSRRSSNDPTVPLHNNEISSSSSLKDTLPYTNESSFKPSRFSNWVHRKLDAFSSKSNASGTSGRSKLSSLCSSMFSRKRRESSSGHITEPSSVSHSPSLAHSILLSAHDPPPTTGVESNYSPLELDTSHFGDAPPYDGDTVDASDFGSHCASRFGLPAGNTGTGDGLLYGDSRFSIPSSGHHSAHSSRLSVSAYPSSSATSLKSLHTDSAYADAVAAANNRMSRRFAAKAEMSNIPASSQSTHAPQTSLNASDTRKNCIDVLSLASNHPRNVRRPLQKYTRDLQQYLSLGGTAGEGEARFMASLADAHRAGLEGTRTEFTSKVNSEMGGDRWQSEIKQSVYGGGFIGGLRSAVNRW